MKNKPLNKFIKTLLINFVFVHILLALVIKVKIKRTKPKPLQKKNILSRR